MIVETRPIDGLTKAKRLKWGFSHTYATWAYMKQLREKNKTMRVYNINPYVEVFRLRENIYGLLCPNNDGMADVWMYVVIGPERVLLVDTGGGLGDQRGLVDELSGGKPCVVVNTHLGPDHSYGNWRFERVYCHEYEADNIRDALRPNMFDYLFDESGKNKWLQFDRSDLPVPSDYELIGVPDGYVFNLGEDFDIELIWTGGHAAGHAMYLDKRDRILFAGDDIHCGAIACGGGPRPGKHYQEYTNLETYRDSLAQLIDRIDEYDYLFPGHFMIDIENNILLDVLDTLNAVIRNPQCYDFKDVHISGDGNNVKSVRYNKFIKGFGTILYNMDGVYRP